MNSNINEKRPLRYLQGFPLETLVLVELLRQGDRVADWLT